MLGPDLAAVNSLWPFIIQDKIYIRSNFGQKNFSTGFIDKIYGQNLRAIWPVYCRKVRLQHIKISAQLHVIEALERHEKSHNSSSQMRLLGGTPPI